MECSFYSTILFIIIVISAIKMFTYFIFILFFHSLIKCAYSLEKTQFVFHLKVVNFLVFWTIFYKILQRQDLNAKEKLLSSSTFPRAIALISQKPKFNSRSKICLTETQSVESTLYPDNFKIKTIIVVKQIL